MIRRLSSAPAFGIPLAFALMACGSSNDASPAPSDAGGSDATTPDAHAPTPTPDASLEDAGVGNATAEDASSNAGEDAQGPPAQLLPGQLLGSGYVLGWTADGQLLYAANNPGGAVFALQPDGGVETAFPANGGDVFPTFSPPGALIQQANVLGVWTRPSGYDALNSDGGFDGTNCALSPDGTKAFYFTGPAGGGDPQMVVLNVDGTRAQTINGHTPTSYYNSNYVFFTAQNGIMFPTGTGFTDGGLSDGIGLMTGTPLTLTAQVPGYGVIYDGSTLVVIDAQNNGSLMRMSDGQTTSFDTGLASAENFAFDVGDANVYYTVGAALKRVSVASPGPATTVLASGVKYLLDFSRDGKQLLYSDGTSYYVAPTSGGSAPVNVFAGPAPAYPYGFFTADSAYVVYSTASDASQGTLTASPASGGPATAAWTGLGNQTNSTAAVSDSRVVTVDAQGNLSIADAAGKVATRFIQAASYSFYISPDGTRLAFSAGTTATSPFVVPVN